MLPILILDKDQGSVRTGSSLVDLFYSQSYSISLFILVFDRVELFSSGPKQGSSGGSEEEDNPVSEES